MSDDKNRTEEELKEEMDIEQQKAKEASRRRTSVVADPEEEDETEETEEKEEMEGEEVGIQPKTREEIVERLKEISLMLNELINQKTSSYRLPAELSAKINNLKIENDSLNQDLAEMDKKVETEIRQKEDVKRRAEKQAEVARTLAEKAKASPEAGGRASLLEQIRKRGEVKEATGSPKKFEEVPKKEEPKKKVLPTLSPGALQRLSEIREKNKEEEGWDVESKANEKLSPEEKIAEENRLREYREAEAKRKAGIPKPPPQEPPKAPPQEPPKEVPKEIPREIPEKAPQEIPEKTPKEIPEGTPEKIPEKTPEKGTRLNAVVEGKEQVPQNIQSQPSILRQATLSKKEANVEGDYETLKKQHVKNAINIFLEEFKNYESEYKKNRSVLKKIGDVFHLTLKPETRKTQIDKINEQFAILAQNPDEKNLMGFKSEINTIIEQIKGEPKKAGRSDLLAICEKMFAGIEHIETAIAETDHAMKTPKP